MFGSILMGFSVGLILGSFFEHIIHKYLLHGTPKLLKKSEYIRSMWKGHTISHHGNYAPEEHYTQDDTNKEEVLTFSWYEGPLIIISTTSLFYVFDVGIRLLLGVNLNVLADVIGACIAFTLYYTAYEGLHAVMHVPHKWIWIRNTQLMIWLNRHHYQHHLNPHTNLNVLLPIADFVLGTKSPLPKDQWKIADAVGNKN